MIPNADPSQRVTRNWRRWVGPGAYAAVVIVVALLRGDDPLALALYRVTLPWSALAYGATSPGLGWVVLGIGAALNGFLLFLIGGALDQRAATRAGAV
jgi:hypothetical protein